MDRQDMKMKIVFDMRKEISAYVDVEALDNGILALCGIFELDNTITAKIPKDVMKQIKLSLKELSIVMTRLQRQYQNGEIDNILSGDRYEQFAI